MINSYLNDKIVEAIRSEYVGLSGKNQHDKTSPSYNDLAKKYNTTKANIALIVRKESRNRDRYKLK